MRKKTLLCLVAITATMWSAAKAQNAGTVDTSWGNNGLVQTSIGSGNWVADIVRKVATYSNGKIIAVGSSKVGKNSRVALARYNADGSPDNTFGKSGSGQLLLIDETGDDSYFQIATDVKILPDGKILVCGRMFDGSSSTVLLLKFNDNGSFDTSFGTKGVMKDYSDMGAEKMVVQSDGKIVVGGYHQDNFTAVRYNPDGSRDNSYGNQGMCKILIPNSINTSYANSIDIQADGKIILGGFFSDSGIWKWGIARININGTIDTSFGDNGIQKMSIGSGNDFTAVVKVLPNGKILIGGHSWDNNSKPPHIALTYSIAFAQLNEDGSWDKSFAKEESGAIRKRLVDGCENYLTDMVVNQDGKIYGSVSIDNDLNNQQDIGIISLTKEGKLNSAFGNNGIVVTDILNKSTDISQAIALQSDGKIIVGASIYTDKGTPFTLVKYHSDSNVGTDIQEVTSDIKTITVYPNPTKEILNIAINETLNSYKVQIFDMAGSIVMTTANTKTIDVSKLDSGNYIVKVICADKQVFVSRFTKK